MCAPDSTIRRFDRERRLDPVAADVHVVEQTGPQPRPSMTRTQPCQPRTARQYEDAALGPGPGLTDIRDQGRMDPEKMSSIMENMGKKPVRRRRSFTPEFKAEIVECCPGGDRSIGQVAMDFDLTETAVREWV
jgi:hypothetical protein